MGAIARTLVGLVVGWIGTRLIGLLGRLHVASPAVRGVPRRTFVRNAALGAVGIVLAEIGIATGVFVWPNKRGAFGSVLTVAASDVPEPGAPPFRHPSGQFFLAHNQDGLLAMWWKCPHLGCTVPWVGPPDSPNAYQCPCHGSMYDYNGERTGGPAPRPLDLMAVTVEGDTVKVDTGAISTRAAYEPDQAVPYPA